MPLFIIPLAAFILKNPLISSEAVQEGLLLCTKTVIPSIFPFLIINNIFIESGLAEILGRILNKPVRALFGVSGCLSGAFVIGTVSGYPAGARAVISLYEKKLCSKEEAERAIAFCNNTGPSFLIAGIGSIWGNYKFGVILFIAQIISAIVVGIIMRKRLHTEQMQYTRIKKVDFSIIPTAISGAVIPMLTICSFVVFFSVWLKMLACIFMLINIPSLVIALNYGFFEVTSGVSFMARNFNEAMGIPLCALCVGWSGLSVHMQVAAFTKKHYISLKPYLLGKFLQGLICMLLTILLLSL